MDNHDTYSDGPVKDDGRTLKIIVIGAGLAGLGAAIALRLAGHEVIILESARAIGEVGAGIQCLPNSSRVLRSWGLGDSLSQKASLTRRCDILGWHGNRISLMDFQEAGDEYGSPFWDFHRADLQNILLERAIELGAELVLDAEVTDIRCDDEKSIATVSIDGQSDREADLVVAADGIHSKSRDILLGKREPPKRTGDMAYRILLDAKDIEHHPELHSLLQDDAVTYWYGPGAHVVTYALRNRTLLNMVLLVPDDMPEDGPSTLEGYVEEMQDLFKTWDVRIGKLLSMCKSVLRWRLCIRERTDTWVHPSGCFALLGDSAHAMLPYLASGAGMCFEDAAVVGHCLARITSKSSQAKKEALAAYERCRKLRTEAVVERGVLQQDLNHLEDGPEQESRDRKMKAFEEVEDNWQRDNGMPLSEGLSAGEDPLVWRRYGMGDWLLRYDCERDVDQTWNEICRAVRAVSTDKCDGVD